MTLSDDKIYTQSHFAESNAYDEVEEEEANFDLDQGNIISPVKLDKYRMQKQLPRNQHVPKNVLINSYQFEDDGSVESEIDAFKA